MSVGPRIIALFKELSDHTKDECANVCTVPHSCCSPEYCEMASEYANEVWHTELPRTDHPTLSFMGPTGCTIAPHFRPLCTLHVCSINGLGFKVGDRAWTKRYFKLRDELEGLMWDLDQEMKPMVFDSEAFDQALRSGHARCEETLDAEERCGAAAVGVVLSERGRRLYFMCQPHLEHNVRNRGVIFVCGTNAAATSVSR